MVRKQRKRISYVLPLANEAGGHRLGVNGLAVDPLNSILYSGGRDGVICAWDLSLDLSPSSDHDYVPSIAPANGKPIAGKSPDTKLRQQVQAHTHWVNDVVLVQNYQALVSASSDITVKIWRPNTYGASSATTIGLHEDYVKTLASPGQSADWVASGGLDRKVYLWDLRGGGEKLKINVGEEENTAKGSVYALACTPTLLADGGPDSIVRVWDPRSGKRITKFVGHTDNIRDILISQDGDTVVTASSDQTVKVWSMTAGRCMNTLTMHSDSVWSLYSDHPRLSVFYSGDRSGVVAKTDTSGCAELDDGLSVAVCQEHGGINKVINAGDYIWTATSSSSINRWLDIDTEAEIAVPDTYSIHRASVATTRSRVPSPPSVSNMSSATTTAQKHIPMQALLRISNAAPFYIRTREESTPASASIRKASEAFVDTGDHNLVPVRALPDHTVEGQHGLIKHLTLNDRRRVLTLDTNSEVVLWDLIQCIPIKSFGKRHVEDVAKEINTTDTVAPWCTVDTRTGSLTCVLEENTCFDAELYADELNITEQIEFRDDQRINLGKWILRYLFDHLIGEQIKSDEDFRRKLLGGTDANVVRTAAPSKIQLPSSPMTSWYDGSSAPTSADTVKAPNGFHFASHTPGMGIGLATPGPVPSILTQSSQQQSLPRTAEESASLKSPVSNSARSPAERLSNDYFSQSDLATTGPATPGGTANGQATDSSGDGQAPLSPSIDAQIPTTPGGEKTGMFGKKMWKGFGMNKLKKTTTNDPTKPAAPVEEAKSEDEGSRSSKVGEERVIEDNFSGVVQRMRMDYEAQIEYFEKREKELDANMERPIFKLESLIQPSLPSETPVLKLPINTVVLIQEDRIDAGGVQDLFEGTVGSLAKPNAVKEIESHAPVWLADLLLKNTIPMKEIVKVSFILEPYQNLLPGIASDGNTRLNANRMLRARKILAYVAERIEPQAPQAELHSNALKPEDYLELYCNDKLVTPTMTLATIRTHVWRSSGDVVLYYKANGRKEIRLKAANPLSPIPHPRDPTQTSMPTHQSHHHQHPQHHHHPTPSSFQSPSPLGMQHGLPGSAQGHHGQQRPPQSSQQTIPSSQHALPPPPPFPSSVQAQMDAHAHAQGVPVGSTEAHRVRTPSISGSHRSAGSHRSHRSQSSNDFTPRSVPAGARYSEEATRQRPPTSGSGGVKRPEGNWI